MSARPRLALVAFACNPYHGSEEGIGWNRAVQAARCGDVTLFCEASAYRADVERWIAEHGKPAGLKFEFLPLRRDEQVLKRIPGGIVVAHRRWQRRAARLVAQRHAEQPFDLVHQVNYATYREPGGLWKLEIPFIWGPVGGTQNVPWRFLPFLGPRDGASEGLRSFLNLATLWTSPRLRRAAKTAEAIFASNSTNVRDLTRRWRRPVHLLADVGVSQVAQTAARRTSHELRILWSGLHIPRKALPLLLHALAQLRDAPWRLEVLGDGRLTPRWRRLANRLGIDDQIAWRGRLPHAEAVAAMAEADLFAFTSLRDSGGTVVLEALAAGTPVLCLDHQGAADYIDETCGVKIPPTNPQDVIRGFARALQRFAERRDLLEAMRPAALARAERYRWEATSREIFAAYDAALGRSGSAPPAANPPASSILVGDPTS